MKLCELVSKYEWKSISPRLTALYPDQNHVLDGYEHVFNMLKSKTPNDTKMRICIDWTTYDDIMKAELPKDECYAHVYGKNGDLNKSDEQWDMWLAKYKDDPERLVEFKESGNKEVRWAIEFSKWEEWAGMEIEADPIFNDEDIIMHVMWEMTFMGFTEETIQEEMDIIDSRKAELDKWTEEGTLDEHTTSFDTAEEFTDWCTNLIDEKEDDTDDRKED